MAEIKSTLDLVLEKTKNLTLSSEEKAAQRRKEIENRIKGLLQKYQDGLLSKSELTADYKVLKKDLNMSKDDAFFNEMIGRLEPTQDNRPLLELMPECCGIDPTAIEEIIENFRSTYLAAEKARKAGVKEDLAQKYNISGSAVLPNLDADEQWLREARQLRAGFEDQLNRFKGEVDHN
jgi:hypothetical protein